MRVEEVAQVWGISARQVYRLIKDGTLPATRKPRDRPVVGYEVDPLTVSSIKKMLDEVENPPIGTIKKLLQTDISL